MRACPFCGNEEITLRPDEKDADVYWVGCEDPDCDFTPWKSFDGEERAIAAWNHRAAEHRIFG